MTSDAHSSDEPALFETKRLRCRRWIASDIDALAHVYGDAQAMRWVGDGEPLSREGCEAWLEVTARNYRTRGYGMFALEAPSTREIVGFCGLVHPGGQVEAEVKYTLRRESWGRGLATEAVRALLLYGAAAHGLRRIIATVAPLNHASQRVLTKAGMTRILVRRNDDETCTHVFEWLAPPADERSR